MSPKLARPRGHFSSRSRCRRAVWRLGAIVGIAVLAGLTDGQQATAHPLLIGFNEGYAQRLPEVTFAERELYASRASLANAGARGVDVAAAASRFRAARVTLATARARDDERLRSVIADSQAAGATVARFTIVWKHVEPRRGGFTWGYYDRVYQQLLVHGIRPLPVLVDSPEWARPSRPRLPGSEFAASYPDRRFEPQWARFAAGVAERYPQSVAIEVWNEPNADHFWGGEPNPRRYAELLATAYDAIKAVRPEMPVLLAGPAPRIDRPLQWDRFLRRAYEHGAADHSDDLSLHPYPTESGPQIAQVLDQVRRAEELTNKHHPGAHIWVTELGFPTDPRARNAVSELRQAGLLTTVHRRLRQLESVPALLVHRVREVETGNPTEDSYGVTGVDGGRKPGFCALVILSFRSRFC